MAKDSKAANMVTVGQFNDIASASVARARLEAAGIYCFLADEHTLGVQWLYTQAIGGFRLQVAQAHEEIARALLAEDSVSEDELTKQALEWQGGDEYYKAEPACPACGSTKIEEKSSKKPLRILSLFVYMPMPLEVKNYRCTVCGEEWR